MTEYTPDTIEAVWKVLRGFSHRMKVEVEFFALAVLGRPACA